MNRGTVGFLMNAYAEDRLLERLAAAEPAVINPLRMRATRGDGGVVEALAINEVSMLRAGPQAAKLRILVDDRERMAELVADGALLSTPAGSTAYNYSAHGPILPIGAGVLALTPMAAFRPRRWRGALIPKRARVTFEVLDAAKRPVSAVADFDRGPRRSADRGRERDRHRPPHPLRPRPRARGTADPRAVRLSATTRRPRAKIGPVLCPGRGV